MQKQAIFIAVLLAIAGSFYIYNQSGGELFNFPGNNSENTGGGALIGGCFVGGCSGQICSDQEGVISTCEYREEYACYQNAVCERQSNGECGWTQTEELAMCIQGAQ